MSRSYRHRFTMSDIHRQRGLLTLLLSATLTLGACSSFDNASNRLISAASPYRMDVVQGNVITREQVDLLRPGMSRIQVREIMGTPLLASVFHADRWDFVFSLKRQNAPPQLRKVTVFFQNDLLERFVADPLPTEAEFVTSLDTQSKSSKSPKAVKLEAAPEVLQKIPAPVKPAEPPTLAPLPASYPPLEPASR
jgi:outer membrane protein assembly factor BamE